MEIPRAKCAAKKIHDFFQDPTRMPAEGIQKASREFVRECQLMSTLRHPHIVQFLGVCCLPGSRMPALVMEQLLTSLHEILDPEPLPQTKAYIPVSLKCSVLHNGLWLLTISFHLGLVATSSRSSTVVVGSSTGVSCCRILQLRKCAYLVFGWRRGPTTGMHFPCHGHKYECPRRVCLKVASYSSITLRLALSPSDSRLALASALSSQGR